MTGWAGLGVGGLGIAATLCPVAGASVAAHVEALGVALTGHVEICRPDEPVAEAAVGIAPAPAPEAPHQDPPQPPAPAPPADRAAEPPGPEPPDPVRTRPAAPDPAPAAPRVRELVVPVRLESTPPHGPPAPAPPRDPSFPAPHYRPAEGPEPPAGRSVVTTTMVVTTPAVLAAALLRPRSGSRSGAASRSRTHTGGSS
ncbi:hypothetical protein [Streptomyces sp. NPDC087300]|uniref:hypothetical protein n=1 Tax=Streptomyces sp. NPDC087300 TaxID=3365780 RepID=UPI0037FFAE8E